MCIRDSRILLGSIIEPSVLNCVQVHFTKYKACGILRYKTNTVLSYDFSLEIRIAAELAFHRPRLYHSVTGTQWLVHRKCGTIKYRSSTIQFSEEATMLGGEVGSEIYINGSQSPMNLSLRLEEEEEEEEAA